MDAGDDAGDSGSAGCDAGTPTYPAGPYGLAVGDTVADLGLAGFADAQKQSAVVETFSLGDFLNPGGAEVFPACSPLGAGAAKPKALLVILHAVWASPSNYEAKSVLPAKHAQYAPLGAEFVAILVEGQTPGAAATSANVVSWTTKYAVDYPTAIEPAHTLNAVQSYPLHLVVDTKTMKIVDVLTGAPDDTSSIWASLAALL
jgi:hypothetical protein